MEPVQTTTPAIQQKLDALHAFGNFTVYGMGIAFMLGCLFTVFLLMTLDFVRSRSEKQALEERMGRSDDTDADDGNL